MIDHKLHEAAHAVLFEKLCCGVETVSVEQRGASLGRTQPRDYSKCKFGHVLAALMAGGIAEMLCGATDTRASCESDMRQINELLKNIPEEQQTDLKFMAFQLATNTVKEHIVQIKQLSDELGRLQTVPGSRVAEMVKSLQ